MQEFAQKKLRVTPLGDQGLFIEYRPLPQRQPPHFGALIQQVRQWPDIRAVVPGWGNVTLWLREPVTLQAVQQRLETTLAQLSSEQRAPAECVDIPVIYGGEYGVDLGKVAAFCGMTPHAVVERHSQAEYEVVMLGFKPGFPYLSGLPDKLAMPRHATPRTHVPAGTVGIAGHQAGIYPQDAPGGWQLIGHTDIRLFEPHAAPPARLQPGMRVRFTVRDILL